MPELFLVSAETAEKFRLRAEATALRKAKYESRNRQRSHGNSKTSRPLYKLRDFIVWDGEGPQDTAYSLFGNSEGMEICYPTLSSLDCLNLIIDTEIKYPARIHVSFGFTYDVSMIIKDLPWRCMNALYKFNHCVWQGFRLEHIPRKWFKVSFGHITVKIFDIQSFFASTLVGALEKWKIGPFGISASSDQIETVPANVPSLESVKEMDESSLVRTFKNLRSEFLWKDIEQIAIYMRLELKYTKILVKELRNSFELAGYFPRSWHGPGALAREAFKKFGIYDAMAICPDEVREASRYGFIGGRFELFKAGHANRPVYVADINSAYPYYCSQLPNLSRGNWRHTTELPGYEHNKFAIYKIRYSAQPDAFGMHPLPYRDKHHGVSWPHKVESWYWAPEAELVKDDPNAVFLESWIFDEVDSNDRPFRFLLQYYDLRHQFKAAGNPAEYCLKLVLNSIYGQLAQRTGWDRKNCLPPKSHQLEWAGFITSSCRAAIYNAARQQGKENLISIDTDGVMGLIPFKLINSDKLGEWEVTEYEDGLFWQSGMYFLKEDGEWKKAKTRGIPKGSYSVETIFGCLRDGIPLAMTKKLFISYGLALLSQKRNLNTWVNEPHLFKMGGNGKRQHIKRRCREPNCYDEFHSLGFISIEMLIDPLGVPKSHPHKLPWLEPPDEKKITMQTLMAFEDTDEMEPWQIEMMSLTN